MSLSVSKNNAVYFISAFFLAVLGTLATIGIINFIVDPANLYDSRHSIEKEIASLLSQGNVGGVQNYDERLTQKYRLEIAQPEPVDMLVIGSSRSMQISSSLMHANVLNLSVSGASIEDYVAILELTDQVHATTTILGIDPWVLNANSGQTGWKSLAVEYSYGLNKLSNESLHKDVHTDFGYEKIRKWLQLFNFEYTQASFQRLLTKDEPSVRSPFLERDNLPQSGTDVISQDGSRVYRLEMQNVPAEEVRHRALTYGLSQPVYSLQAFDSIDQDKLRLLEAVIQHFKKKGDVWLFLPPYHPDAYVNVVRQVPMVLTVEDALRALALKENVKLMGSYDPGKTNCMSEEFFDGMHPKNNCVVKILER